MRITPPKELGMPVTTPDGPGILIGIFRDHVEVSLNDRITPPKGGRAVFYCRPDAYRWCRLYPIGQVSLIETANP